MTFGETIFLIWLGLLFIFAVGVGIPWSFRNRESTQLIRHYRDRLREMREDRETEREEEDDR